MLRLCSWRRRSAPDEITRWTCKRCNSCTIIRDCLAITRLGPLAPNYSAYFQVASINHNILPVPKLWAQYVDHNLLPGFQGDSGVTFFWPAWGDRSDAGRATFSMNLANFRDVGVKYVLTNPGQSALPTSTSMQPMRTCQLEERTANASEEPRILAWFQSVAANPAKPAAERFVLRAVSYSLTRVRAVAKDQPNVTSEKNGLPVTPMRSSGASSVE